MFKNLKHVLLRFLSIKSNHQLYPLTNKSQEISILKSRNNKTNIQLIKINLKS